MLSGPGLDGHSDADAIAHACIDALLSAAGLGDIGSWFPDTDEAHRGANSIEMLSQVAVSLTENGWSVANVDITIVCDEPKIGPHKAVMQNNLSAAAGGEVTLKGKTTEGLAGLQGGVQCHAVALITKGLN
jgi:2-C-methyl-D-erythritol 2,4-cyclodiphosphate synthase